MALIDVTTFGDGTDKYLELGNEEWGRRLTIGSTWVKIRIGAMLAIVPDGTNDLTGSSLRIGGSAARNDHLGSLAGNLWYGVAMATNNTTDLGGDTFTYNAGAGLPYFQAASAVKIRMLNGVVSGSSSNGSWKVPATTGSTIRRWPVVVQLEKSGTDMIVSGWAFVTNPVADFSKNNFLDMMAQTGTPTINGNILSTLGTNTFANHDTNAIAEGETVAAHIGWTRPGTPLRLYSIAVARVE